MGLVTREVAQPALGRVSSDAVPGQVLARHIRVLQIVALSIGSSVVIVGEPAWLPDAHDLDLHADGYLNKA